MTKKTKKRFDELETELKDLKTKFDRITKRIEVLEFEKKANGEKYLFKTSNGGWYLIKNGCEFIRRRLEVQYVSCGELVSKMVCFLRPDDNYRICGDYIEIYNINDDPSLISVHKIKAPSFPEVPLDLYIAAKKSNKIKVEVKIK